MGFTSTETVEPQPVQKQAQPGQQDLEPSPEELRDFLSERSDRDPDSLEEQARRIRDGIQFLDPVAAYYIVGQELGIDVAAAFETKQREYSLDIDALQPDMNQLDLTATVQRITDINTFERDDGSKGKVCNLILTDDTGRCVLTLWDDATQLTAELAQGDTVRVENGYSQTASDYCQNRLGCEVEVRIGDGKLLKKDDGEE